MSISLSLFGVPGLISGTIPSTPIPLTIPNLILYLDSSDSASLTINSGIDVWSDLSGNGNNAVLSTGTKPQLATGSLNGRDTVSFNSSALTISSLVGVDTNSDLTFYLVGKFSALNTNAAFFTGGTSTPTDEIVFFKDAGNILVLRINSAGGDATIVYANTDWNILKGTHTTTQRNISSLTDSSSSIATKALGTTNLLHIGGYRGAFYYLNGNIAEILFYNRLLTTPEDTAIKAYLQTKWGL